MAGGYLISGSLFRISTRAAANNSGKPAPPVLMGLNNGFVMGVL
jgi:hypothetical protein